MNTLMLRCLRCDCILAVQYYYHYAGVGRWHKYPVDICRLCIMEWRVEKFGPSCAPRTRVARFNSAPAWALEAEVDALAEEWATCEIPDVPAS